MPGLTFLIMFPTSPAYHGIREAVRLAKKLTLENFREKQIEQEPPFTDRLVACLEDLLNGQTILGLKWSAKTLTDRGGNAQEAKYGADLLGALRIETPEFRVAKGFLAQAKLIEPGEPFNINDASRLYEQCEKMLRLTSASFVFVYSQSDITVVPAIAVTSATPRNPHEFDSISLETFFSAHVLCYLGDRRIRRADANQLRQLCDKFRARSGIQLTAELAE